MMAVEPGTRWEDNQGARAQPLPADLASNAIKDAAFQHRVSIILGATGCGKSTRVPQYLLDELGGPVLCTQPRRLAVVSIAKRVAEEMEAELGGDVVGYRIGARPHCTPRTRIVFATAGLVLQDLLGQGARALQHYKVIIADECHERSAESDLLLSCLRELMKQNRRIKLVLMSATCDVAAYSRYFQDVTEGRLARVQINDVGLNLRNLLLSTTVKYLEDVVQLLSPESAGTGRSAPMPLPIEVARGKAPQPSSSPAGFLPQRATSRHRQHQSGSGSGHTPLGESSGEESDDTEGQEEGGAGAGTAASHGGGGVSAAQLQRYSQLLESYRTKPAALEHMLSDTDLALMRDLVVALHARDGDLSHAVLCFLPTYRTLEMAHELLQTTGLPLSVHALHSSIDVDELVSSMEASDPGRRKIVIATNIAESSVTIPSVYYVIDSCRTLQLSWDRVNRRSEAKIVFASKSQCDQRKGRTGRTCDGVVYRLLPRRTFLNDLSAFEAPAITLLPLRTQTLDLLCAESQLSSNPKQLLSRTMDPPRPEVVDDALEYLVSVTAATRTSGAGRTAHAYYPTPLGRFLGELPVSIEASQLLMHGGKLGLLQPSAVLAALLNVTPMPIHQPFASAEHYRQNLKRYHPPAEPADAPSVLLANLAAYQFWQHAFRDPRRLGRLQRLGAAPAVGQGSSATGSAEAGEDGGAGPRESEAEEEREWCAQHSLVRSSLHSVEECSHVLLGGVHRHRPSFLNSSSQPTAACLPGLHSLSGSASSSNGGPPPYFDVWMRHSCRLEESRVAGEEGQLRCQELPWTASDLYGPGTLHQLEQLCVAKDAEPGSLAAASGCALPGAVSSARGSQLCRFFRGPRGCARGASCAFSHDVASTLSYDVLLKLRQPLTFERTEPAVAGHATSAVGSSGQGLLSFGPDDLVLLLGEGDCSFTQALLNSGCPAALVASVLPSHDELLELYPSCARRIPALATGGATALLFGLDARQLHSLGRPAPAQGVSMQMLTAVEPYHLQSLDPELPPWDLASTSVIVWQHPHTAQDNDDASHKRLIADFLASAAAVMLRERFRAKVVMTLANDQYCRWGVEALARDSFFFLTASQPFSRQLWKAHGYSPRRADKDESFPAVRELTYQFELHIPSSLL